MKLMVVGGGGREHAIITKLAENPEVEAIYALPGNGGISYMATCVPISATDIDGQVAFAKENQIDFAVVAPDDPLVMGAVDALNEAGILAFGPNKAAAIIEGSKVFSKQLMRDFKIPTAAYETFDDADAAITYLEAQTTWPQVIKADGLALGKGVLIAADLAEAKEAIKEIMTDKAFGASGNQVVIEEFLEGPEVSVLAFTDGKTVLPMVSSMDHKRALDGDLGLNTGGMGTVAPNPYYAKDVADLCMEQIFLPTMHAMNSLGRTFKGCLYFGLMLTKGGPKVIEYNCRFGDPETQVVLPLLKSDLLEVMIATAKGELSNITLELDDRWAACVIVASGGYPKAYEKGLPINGLTEGQLPEHEVTVYHAGTKLQQDGSLVTSGGRVMGVTALGDSLEEALATAYAGADAIDFKNKHMRRDIGQRALKAICD